jgi:hypothetical protein
MPKLPDRPAASHGVLADVQRFHPTDAEVDALIAKATAHPLGLDYLRDGELGSVAAAFGTHAFTVIAARERLTNSSESPST